MESADLVLQMLTIFKFHRNTISVPSKLLGVFPLVSEGAGWFAFVIPEVSVGKAHCLFLPYKHFIAYQGLKDSNRYEILKYFYILLFLSD